MALWSIELSEFDIQYHPRTAIKGQAIVDFIAEFASAEDEGAENPQWSIFTDWSSNKKAGGVGIVLISLEGDEIECMIRLNFPTTNNEAEYEALIASLDLAKAVEAMNVVIHCDSQVITSQVNGKYECKGEKMKKYWEQAKRRVDELETKIVQIPRGENEQADRLAKTASAESMITLDKVLSFIQPSPLIDVVNIQEIGSENNWTTPLISYLKDGTLPDGKEAARKLKVQSARFVVMKDVLYKRGFSRPYLRCLGPKEADYVMREVHEGIYGNHSGSRSLVHKLIRAGYYWPTMQNDTQTWLEGANGIWLEELPSVLWAYRTTVRTPTGETPFQLTYGSEEVIPAEIGLTSYRVDNHNEGRNDEELRLQLDLVD
ncbi:uncharacterized protein LOC142624692 [Castanea sativa]|uniref:uncharacterized protein LOC142624692 n=1 Tax=Castanea sativa TaxID=21020 RepID=UPI003F64EE4F